MTEGYDLDLSKVTSWEKFCLHQKVVDDEAMELRQDAKDFLEFHEWCNGIVEEYVGFLHVGIVAVFLFKFVPAREDVDPWVWVVVGDLPSAYITVEECKSPAAALDGYIGAMSEWVDAARHGKPTLDLVPVNVEANPENAALLKSRLDFLDEQILVGFEEDLRS